MAVWYGKTPTSPIQLYTEWERKGSPFKKVTTHRIFPITSGEAGEAGEAGKEEDKRNI